MMICMTCGSTKWFTRQNYGYKNYTETEIIRGSTEETEDWDDYDDYDGEMTDSDDVKCKSCGSVDIEDSLSDAEIAGIIVKHTTKEGNWSVEELETEDHNPEKIAELMLVI